MTQTAHDMRPQGYDDTSYVRTVYGTELDNSYMDLTKGLKRLDRDFYAGNCASGVVYDHDTGIAYTMTPLEVKEDFVYKI